MLCEEPSFAYIQVENLEMTILFDMLETAEMFEVVNVVEQQKVRIGSHYSLSDGEFKKPDCPGRIQDH